MQSDKLLELCEISLLGAKIFLCLAWSFSVFLLPPKDHWGNFNFLVLIVLIVRQLKYAFRIQLCLPGQLQKDNIWELLLPSTMWVSGVQLRSPGWAICPTKSSLFYFWNVANPITCIYKFHYISLYHHHGLYHITWSRRLPGLSPLQCVSLTVPLPASLNQTPVRDRG